MLGHAAARLSNAADAPTHVEGEITLGRLIRRHSGFARLLHLLLLMLQLLVMELQLHLLLLMQNVQDRSDIFLQATL